METTVKIETGGQILTSVEFGSVDYKINTDVNFQIRGDGILLFDKATGNKLGRAT